MSELESKDREMLDKAKEIVDRRLANYKKRVNTNRNLTRLFKNSISKEIVGEDYSILVDAGDGTTAIIVISKEVYDRLYA